MNIPIELIVLGVGSIVALQGWILVEIISVKVRLAKYEDLDRRINNLEKHVYDSL